MLMLILWIVLAVVGGTGVYGGSEPLLMYWIMLGIGGTMIVIRLIKAGMSGGDFLDELVDSSSDSFFDSGSGGGGGGSWGDD